MATKVKVSMTGGQLALGFFVQLIVNALVIWLANLLFPNLVVLGTASLSLWGAVFMSMGALALLGTLAVPLFEWKERMMKKELGMAGWMIGYFVVDFIGVWIIARFPDAFGLGVSAWWVVLILAVVLDFVQGMGIMLAFPKPKK